MCSPIVTLITSFAFLVGLGGAPMFSIALGEKDNDKAKKILSNALLMLIIISSIIMLIFYLFSEPILFLFGASELSIEYALSYLRIYLIGTFFSLLTLGLNQYLTAQGESSKAMMTIIIGCVLNIGLDPLFMYFFHLGVKGAALATIISQFISFIFVIFILLKKTTIKLSFGGYDKKIMLMIIKLGISQFIIIATDSIILILLNNYLQSQVINYLAVFSLYPLFVLLHLFSYFLVYHLMHLWAYIYLLIYPHNKHFQHLHLFLFHQGDVAFLKQYHLHLSQKHLIFYFWHNHDNHDL